MKKLFALLMIFVYIVGKNVILNFFNIPLEFFNIFSYFLLFFGIIIFMYPDKPANKNYKKYITYKEEFTYQLLWTSINKFSKSFIKIF